MIILQFSSRSNLFSTLIRFICLPCSSWYPVNIYLFKINNRNTRKICGICSNLTIKTLEDRQLHYNLGKLLLQSRPACCYQKFWARTMTKRSRKFILKYGRNCLTQGRLKVNHGARQPLYCPPPYQKYFC